MATIDNNIAQLTVKEFLSKDKYVIPIYQRNYDWGGEKERLCSCWKIFLTMPRIIVTKTIISVRLLFLLEVSTEIRTLKL